MEKKQGWKTKKAKRTSNAIALDSEIKAKKPGRRVSESGNVYYESRPNHADENRKKKPYLKDGGMMARGGTLEGREEHEGYKYLIWHRVTKGYSVGGGDESTKKMFDNEGVYFETYDDAKEHAEISIRSVTDDDYVMKEGGSVKKVSKALHERVRKLLGDISVNNHKDKILVQEKIDSFYDNFNESKDYNKALDFILTYEANDRGKTINQNSIMSIEKELHKAGGNKMAKKDLEKYKYYLSREEELSNAYDEAESEYGENSEDAKDAWSDLGSHLKSMRT